MRLFLFHFFIIYYKIWINFSKWENYFLWYCCSFSVKKSMHSKLNMMVGPKYTLCLRYLSLPNYYFIRHQPNKDSIWRSSKNIPSLLHHQLFLCDCAQRKIWYACHWTRIANSLPVYSSVFLSWLWLFAFCFVSAQNKQLYPYYKRYRIWRGIAWWFLDWPFNKIIVKHILFMYYLLCFTLRK